MLLSHDELIDLVSRKVVHPMDKSDINAASIDTQVSGIKS